MIPRAVQEQSDRADAALAAHIANTGQQPAPVTAPATADPVAPSAGTAQAPPIAPTEPVVQAPDSWELKYRVLNGKYITEVPKLAATVRELTEKIRGLEAAASAAPKAVQTDQADDDVRSRYGEDFATAVEAVVESRVKDVVDRVQSSVDVVEQANAQRSRQDFFRDLSGYVPSYAEIDIEPGFTAFLDEFDAMTGRVRREFFTEADASNDAARVAGFFRTYLSTKTAPIPTVVTPVLPSVDRLIVPDAGRGSNVPAGKKQWTSPEIAAFYAAARRGTYTDAQYNAIDADISAAQAEGRVR